MPPSPEFRLRTAVREHLDQVGLEFLAEFLSRAVQKQPENMDALTELGRVLTELGRFDEGLAVDMSLAQLAPQNPIVHYNLGCSLALLGRREEALASLRRAIELGYDDPDFLRSDDDLSSLREDPEFLALLRILEQPGN